MLFIQILNICVVVKKIHAKGTQTIVVSEQYPLELLSYCTPCFSIWQRIFKFSLQFGVWDEKEEFTSLFCQG